MKLNSILLLLFVFTFGTFVSAQSERKITRKGNTQYETGDFVEAEVNYKKAIEENSNLLEAQFNLGDALAKQERFDEAIAAFDLVSTTSEDESLIASALHNKGNMLLQQQDLEGAVESYKEALRINPKDHQTRYNYAYAKNALAQQQQQEQQEQDQEQDEENQDENNEDKEENKDDKEKGDQKNDDSENQDQEKSEEEKDKEKEEQQDKGKNKEDESEQEQQDKGQTDGDESEEEQQEQQPKPKENQLSPEEAKRLLEALKQEENKVQAKMKKHKIKGTKVKIEKDW